MAIKMSNDQIVEFLNKMKPKIKKELLQTSVLDREDLEQEMIYFMVKFLKEKEFEEIDFIKVFEENYFQED